MKAKPKARALPRPTRRTKPAAKISDGQEFETIELVPAKLRLRSILVPMDFSPESLKALKYAIPFAEQFGAELILLNVVEPLPFADLSAFPLALENEQVVTACRTKLERIARHKSLPRGLVSKTLIRQGQSFQEITETARKLRVDLIIISTHGYTGLKHALLGSTAERVVRHAPCPVLVVRNHERDFV